MLVTQRRVFFGWWIVAAAFLVDLYVGGTFSLGFTAFFKPLVDEFGWSYFAVSLAASIRGIEMGIAAPLAGFLADRWGPRRVALVGVVVMGFGFILLSFTRSLFMFYTAFAVIAIGASGASSVVMMVAVANWFDKKIGRAMGFMVTGFGAGGIMIPVIIWLISSHGWRTSLIILGISVWIICIPATLLLRHKPEQYGYLPDGQQLDNRPALETARDDIKAEPRKSHPDKVDVGPRDVLRSRAFWLISLSMAIRLVLANTVVIHVMPYLIGIGFSQPVAATVAATVSLLSIPGRIGLGWLGDIIDKRVVIATAYSLMTLGMFMFLYAQRWWALVIFIVAFSIGNGGTVTMRAAIQREYFGRGAFGSIQGLMMAIMTIGSITGPAIAGWLYDNTGSYETTWLAYAFLGGLAIPMILMVRRPVKRGSVGT